ncbi:rCG25421 [Rattus norvegicus]|uniref:RCG25421 n=1 Tax=Rattus norvegicus TaxID=10116 RepID=A6I316_RAT|nr:rCG25421 [Rattus norvegicus]
METRSCCKGVDPSSSLSHLDTHLGGQPEARTPASGNGERVRQDNPLVIRDVEGRSHSAHREDVACEL